jgi:hypothetical protein
LALKPPLSSFHFIFVIAVLESLTENLLWGFLVLVIENIILRFVSVIAVVESLVISTLSWDFLGLVTENIVLYFVSVIAVVESLVILTRRRSPRGKSLPVSGTAGAHDEHFQAQKR